MSEQSAPFPQSNAPSAASGEAPKPAQPASASRRTATLLALVALFLLGGLAAGSWVYYQQRQTELEETAAYHTLAHNDNPADYEAFLAKFPDSRYAPEVKKRWHEVERMLQRWATISLSDQVSDFVRFKEQFSHPRYLHLCDLKIDSLDFVLAQRAGTEASFQSYLDNHPEGRYASEASIAQGMLRDQEVPLEERELVVSVVRHFFEGMEARDEKVICSNITATMKRFLHQSQVTKATVVQTIDRMYNSHIRDCQFIVNRDIEVTRQPGAPETASYTVRFTLDQHILRDDEGKTFGSYRCTAEVTPQLLISSLTLQELSRQ